MWYKFFFIWLFSTPTAIVAIFSLIVAFLTYVYQRREKRKNRACNVVERYGKEILPKIRYINKTFELIDIQKYIKFFDNFSKFDSSELNDFLTKNRIEKNDFTKKLNDIDKDVLKKALSNTGCSSVIVNIHNVLVSVNDDSIGLAFFKFVLDMLNDLETLATLLRYNIAEEKLAYKLMHQSFLKNIVNWYFFIADNNHNDENRYYDSIIWLYNVWNKRNVKYAKSIQKKISRMSRIRKL